MKVTDHEESLICDHHCCSPSVGTERLAGEHFYSATSEHFYTAIDTWLMARDIRKFTSGADVACALFLGTDKVRILDRRSFNSDIFTMINDVMIYILSKINVEYIIKHVKREERPELPEEALREAGVNALAHRDYRSTANVQIYIFSDRVEIVSPGGLPVGMSRADLGTRSVPRNPILFGTLNRMEAVEHIGSGIRRMQQLCLDYGLNEPKIEASENWFTITFPRTGIEHTKEPESQPESLSMRILHHLDKGPLGKSELSRALGQAEISGQLNHIIRVLIRKELIAYTLPEKPGSRLQKYRLTEKGRVSLKKGAG